MNSPLNNRIAKWLPYLKTALGILLLLIVVTSVNISELQQIFRKSRPLLLLISAVATFVTFDIQVLLYGFIASPFAKIPHLQLMIFTLIGRFFSLFLPSSVGGDFVKGFYLVPYFDNAAIAYASVVIQRFLGGLSTLLVGVIAGLFYLPEPTRTFFGNVIAIGALVCAAAGLIGWRFWNLGTPFVRKINLHCQNRVVGAISAFTKALFLYKHEKTVLGVAFALSTLSTIIAAGMFMLLAYTLNIDMSFPQAVVIASFTMLSVVVPLTPGGVGVSEGAFVVTAVAMGVDREEALAVALLSRILGYICSLPGGVLFLLVRTRRTT